MKWEEVRKAYPNKFVVYNIIKECQKDNLVHVTDLALIEVFDTLSEAYKYYKEHHKENNNITIGDTRKENLEYKIERISLLR